MFSRGGCHYPLRGGPQATGELTEVNFPETAFQRLEAWELQERETEEEQLPKEPFLQDCGRAEENIPTANNLSPDPQATCCFSGFHLALYFSNS